MKWIQNFDKNADGAELERLLQNCSGTAVTLGKFDGIHRGHKKLIRAVCGYAAKRSAGGADTASVVLTFGKTPYEVVHGQQKPVLTENYERYYLLKRQEVDILLEYPFTQALRSMEPETFVREILVELLHCRFVAVGKDFCFGKDRKGNADYLREEGGRYGFEACIVEKEQENKTDIGSTRVAEEILQGHMETAAILLGHPYFLIGRVEEGAKLGRQFGFPTINQPAPPDKLLPPNGVYAARALFSDGGRLNARKGVTNIGTKPTVSNGSVKTVETNLFDYSGDLYGKEILLELHSFIRPERRFESRETLAAQIARDAETARDWIGWETFPCIF